MRRYKLTTATGFVREIRERKRNDREKIISVNDINGRSQQASAGDNLTEIDCFGSSETWRPPKL